VRCETITDTETGDDHDPDPSRSTQSGEMLLEEFLKPMKLTQLEAAEKMGVSQKPAE